MAKILITEYQKWLANDFLTWQWFLKFAFLFLSWAIWYMVVDRKRLPEILFFGILVSLVCVSTDVIGLTLGIWSYPHSLIPGVHYIVSVDFGVLPVSYMLFYQCFQERHAFLAAGLLALGASFIGEPLYVWLGLYDPGYWRYFYTIPLYLSMFLGARAITRAVFKGFSNSEET